MEGKEIWAGKRVCLKMKEDRSEKQSKRRSTTLSEMLKMLSWVELIVNIMNRTAAFNRKEEMVKSACVLSDYLSGVYQGSEPRPEQ